MNGAKIASPAKAINRMGSLVPTVAHPSSGAVTTITSHATRAAIIGAAAALLRLQMWIQQCRTRRNQLSTPQSSGNVDQHIVCADFDTGDQTIEADK
jgi:hypothetical protein